MRKRKKNHTSNSTNVLDKCQQSRRNKNFGNENKAAITYHCKVKVKNYAKLKLKMGQY